MEELYQELETKYNKLRTSNTSLIKEKDDLLAAKKVLEEDFGKLKNEYDLLNDRKGTLDDEYTLLKNKYDKLDESYKALATQSSQKLAEQAQKNQDLLAQLEEKEKKLQS